MRFDATFKELLQAAPPRLAQMLVGAEPVEFLTVEFPSVKVRRPDAVTRLTDGNIHHVEVQSENDDEMAWRMLEYYALIRRQYGQPLLQQVLYIGAAPLTTASEIAEPRLSFSYDVVDLRELDGEALLESPSLADKMIALLCRLDDERQGVRRVLEQTASMPRQARDEALTKILILSQLRSLTDIILAEVKAMNVAYNFEQVPEVRELILKRESRLLTRQLEHRFGKLPEWARQKIEAASEEQVEAWGLQMLDAARLEEALR
jgi:predicted transposase YdaD